MADKRAPGRSLDELNITVRQSRQSGVETVSSFV